MTIVTANDIVERVALGMAASRAQDAYCQSLLVTKNARCGNMARLRCPECKRRYCRKCAAVTSCCPVSVADRAGVEVLECKKT